MSGRRNSDRVHSQFTTAIGELNASLKARRDAARGYVHYQEVTPKWLRELHRQRGLRRNLKISLAGPV